MMVREVVGGPASYRDASNTESRHPWRMAPTPISEPGRPLRTHDNPFNRINNNLKTPRPGNPNVSQTLLAKVGHNFTADHRPRKRPRHGDSNIPTVTVSAPSWPHGGGPGPRGNIDITESDIRVIDPLHATNGHNNSVPNDAETIDLEASSGDLGERVPRIAKSSSPDPMNLVSPQPRHDFEIHPAEHSSRPLDKGKGRAMTLSELVVEGSEEDESIEEGTPPLANIRQSNAWRLPEIRRNIVPERRSIYEAVGVKSIDLTTRTVVGKMKRKDEGTLGNQRSAALPDPLGTSSSYFLNSPREREKIQTLPLEAWCLGLHLFQHSESAPLELMYDTTQQQIRVVCNTLPEKFEFKLTDLHSAMIVNDAEGLLKENVVIQFTTAQRDGWKRVERRYKGFIGADQRGKGILTLLISAAKERGFSVTSYQKFVTSIRRVFHSSAVETIGPSKGKTIWNYAIQAAEMFEQTEYRQGRGVLSEDVVAEPSVYARCVTPHSSTSGRTRTSCSELKPPNDPGPSVSHRRSARQSAIREKQTSPLLTLPVQLDPDEVILMYPPTGTGALSIMQSDFRRLQPEEYLNDTLIEFGLKIWLNDLRERDPTLADQIHVFSSFFYKKLNNKKNPEDGYKSVRKWTAKAPLFDKKYVIVPINENIHWYLAIIYEPEHTLKPPLPVSHTPNARATRKQKLKQERAEAAAENAITSEPTLAEVLPRRLSSIAQVTKGGSEVDTSSTDATRATSPSATANEELENAAVRVFNTSCSITARSEPLSTNSAEIQTRDPSPHLALPYEDSMDIDTHMRAQDNVPSPTCGIAETSEPSRSRPSSVTPTGGFTHKAIITENEDSGEDQQQEAEVDDMLAVTQSSSGDLAPRTYIFTLDSLGTRHPQAIKVLKHYLSSEAKDKHNFDEVRDAVGKQVQVPVQPNSWDCGVYLLHFVKVFMSAPSEFMERILSTRGTMPSSERREMWQEQEIPQYRDYLKFRIMQLSKEWKTEKTAREEAASKRGSGEVLEVEVLSSEGEVDIVEDIPNVKPTSAPGQKQFATRFRG